MRRAFLTWLSLLFCAVFAVGGVLAYFQALDHAKKNNVRIMATRLTDLMSLIDYASSIVSEVVEINDASTVSRARALSKIIQLDPNVLQDQEALQGICNELGADQICVTDAEGVTIAAVPQKLRGYNFRDDEQGRHFLECIENPGCERCVRSTSNSRENGQIQFAGVPRLDAKGLVQLGFRPRHELTVRSAGSFGNLVPRYHLGEGGTIIAFRGGELLNKNTMSGSLSCLLDLPAGQEASVELNDVEYLAYTVVSGEYRLVGLLDYREIHRVAFDSVWRLILSNLALFALMFGAVAYLLQLLVVGAISRINNSLNNISNGNLDEPVDEASCQEFATLSSAVNRMVDSLRAYGTQERERMRRELELARNIQSAALPNKFPAFPNHPEFDLYATCTQAKAVGGDFYDFFMPGTERLCFLVADVSAYGIPAALFMMRCMSIIRALARSGAEPAELVSQANHSLCESNTLGMRVRLFYGSLDIKTGDLVYVNAGPLRALRRSAHGEYEVLRGYSGISLGHKPTAEFSECHITLQEGDRLFLYTAGAIEATDDNNTPFGEHRLMEALRAEAPTMVDVLRAVRASLRRFIGSNEPNADITMLGLEYKGLMHAQASLTVHAGQPEGVVQSLSAPLESIFAAPLSISDIEASVHSILNALPDDCEVRIDLRCNEERAEVVLHYPLEHFDPLLGLPHLPMDHAEYQTAPGGGSILTLRKNLE